MSREKQEEDGREVASRIRIQTEELKRKREKKKLSMASWREGVENAIAELALAVHELYDILEKDMDDEIGNFDQPVTSTAKHLIDAKMSGGNAASAPKRLSASSTGGPSPADQFRGERAGDDDPKSIAVS